MRDPGSAERAGYTVTVYGSGEPSPEVLELAFELGRGIARRGWILRNGGYGGTMEAAARGAREEDGRVVGVTCRAFGRPGPNRYLSETIETATLLERLSALVEEADAFAALPGGTGTLTEVFLTWELMGKGLLPPRTLCLVGRAWDPWWGLFAADPQLAPRLSLLCRSADAAEALERLAPPVAAGSRRSR